MDEFPTLPALKALRVVDLKEKLVELGLTTSGLKADLVARLHAYYQEEQARQQQEQSETEPGPEQNDAAEEQDPLMASGGPSEEPSAEPSPEPTLEEPESTPEEPEPTPGEPEPTSEEPEPTPEEPEPQPIQEEPEPTPEEPEPTPEEPQLTQEEPEPTPEEPEPTPEVPESTREEPEPAAEVSEPELASEAAEGVSSVTPVVMDSDTTQEAKEQRMAHDEVIADQIPESADDKDQESERPSLPADEAPSASETTTADVTQEKQPSPAAEDLPSQEEAVPMETPPVEEEPEAPVEEKSMPMEAEEAPAHAEDSEPAKLVPAAVPAPAPASTPTEPKFSIPPRSGPPSVDAKPKLVIPKPPTGGMMFPPPPPRNFRPPAASSSSMDELEGDSTPAGPIQRKEAAPKPVPLMSLHVEPPPTDEQQQQHDGPKDDGPKEELHIPKALEDVFAFKEVRAMQSDGDVTKSLPAIPASEDTSYYRRSEPTALTSLVEDMEDGDKKERGSNKRQKKKKKKKKNRPEQWARQAEEAERRKREEVEEAENDEPKVEIEYVQDKLDLDPSDPMYRTFSKIFETFKIEEEEDEAALKEKEKAAAAAAAAAAAGDELKKVPKMLEEDDMLEEKDDDDEDDDDQPKLSKRKLKKLNRLSVAELKQLVSRPDVVEMHDVTARDPRLLVHLKSTRNTVPVPRHWCFKRKYLQGKRGIEKPPFDLPDFIKKTGIMEMRAALQEKEQEKNLKTKMREKVRPKLGKIDIDYQKLHDAFFKWQTKPRMTLHGDLYYEGKEFEIRLKEKKPGDLSDDLRTALGMPVGPNAHKVPPPWLIAMQRYGPPPSYPNLKIPGLNAPIPDGCSFGYHAGGWGKPPVDESGKPLYGDVFGTSDAAYNQSMPQEEIDTSLWGELESESEEEESSSEEEEEEEEDAGDKDAAAASGLQTPVIDAGLTTPSGISSVGGLGVGLETPELLELRKKRIEADMEGGETPNLYTVLPEKRNDRIGASMMGSSHTYDLTQAGAGAKKGASAGLEPGGVELALNPEEVDLMDTDAMTARAEEALREQQASLAKEDLSDMVAEHAAKQSHKRKRMAAKEDGQKGGGGPGAKKYKEFKF